MTRFRIDGSGAPKLCAAGAMGQRFCALLDFAVRGPSL